MKKYFLFFTLLWAGMILHLGSTNSYASFYIVLNNGRTIQAEKYRTEGEHLLFYFEGGVIKVLKSEVQSILGEEDKIKEKKIEERSENKKDILKTPERTLLAKDLVKKGEDTEGYKRKKVEISERLEEAKKDYFSTSNKSEKDNARKIMISISKELFALEDEVMKKNNGVLPEWWKQ